MTVSLVGYIDVPLDCLNDVQNALEEHIRLTLAETGCIAFEVSADLSIKGRFNVSEEFTDQAAFDIHQTRAIRSHWGNLTRGFHRNYEIRST